MAKSNEFSVGQLVRLKSGGPDMTVQMVIPPSPILGKHEVTYRCQWFAGKKLDSGDFPPESLTPIEPTTNA